MMKRGTAACVLGLCAVVLAGCGGGGGTVALSPYAITLLGQGGNAPGPTAAGDIAGGEEIRVFGRGFEDPAEVMFGAQPAASVTFVSATELRAMTPVMPTGTFDLTVRNPDGTTIVAPNAITFDVPPAIQTILAIDGKAAGRNSVEVNNATVEVEVTGANFIDGAEVTLAGVPVTTTFVDAAHVRFTAPARATELYVDVRVTNPVGLYAETAAGLLYTQEFSLAPQGAPVDEEGYRHLLRRAGFGASDAYIQAERATALGATVNRLLTITTEAQLETDALAPYGTDLPPINNISSRANQEWWIHMIRNSQHPLRDRLAFFLHEHFATSQTGLDGDERWWIHEQIKLFRRFSLPVSEGGLDYNWQALLVEVCKDRAMLEWLDGTNSRRGAPNENFARELWELFMLGEGRGYTQPDIVEAAKAFTGFDDVDVPNETYETVSYIKTRHDERPKTIFGVTGNFGYDNVAPYHEDGAGLQVDDRDTDGGIVALTLQQRPNEASTFICRKLAIHFLVETPDDAMVDALAQILRNNNWNLRPVLQALLNSQAMFSQGTRKCQIKQPVDYVFGFLRTTGIDHTDSRIRSGLNILQQSLLQPPDVDGWPRGNAWMGGQAMLERINFLRDVVILLDDTPSQIDPLVPPPGQRSAPELVDHIARTLDVNLTATARTKAEEYVVTELDNNDNVVPFAFDPTNSTHLRMKSRGLLYLLAGYHDGHRQ